MLNFLMRTFALSLSIFWRALPMWVVLFAIVYVLASALQSSWILLVLVLMLGTGTTMFLMMFNHIRAGLSALGETTAPDLGKLVRKAMKFCFFVGMLNLLVGVVNIGGLFVMSTLGLFQWDQMLQLATAADADSASNMEALFATGPFYAYSIVMNIATQLVYCAIAVPMAANAAACSPKARDYEIFWGFGSGTWRMFILMLASTTILTVLAVGYVLFATGIMAVHGEQLTALMTGQADGAGWQLWSSVAMLVAVPVLAVVWLVSLWCAGATLCFIDRRNIREAVFQAEIERIYEAPMDRTDLRELRMARMNGVLQHG